jgi:hypothetical protein
MDKRFIEDVRNQILEKTQVRKDLIQKNLRLIQEIKNNVNRRKELTKEIRNLYQQLSRIKSAVKKSANGTNEGIPGKIDRV